METGLAALLARFDQLNISGTQFASTASFMLAAALNGLNRECYPTTDDIVITEEICTPSSQVVGMYRRCSTVGGCSDGSNLFSSAAFEISIDCSSGSPVYHAIWQLSDRLHSTGSGFSYGFCTAGAYDYFLPNPHDYGLTVAQNSLQLASDTADLPALGTSKEWSWVANMKAQDGSSIAAGGSYSAYTQVCEYRYGIVKELLTDDLDDLAALASVTLNPAINPVPIDATIDLT